MASVATTIVILGQLPIDSHTRRGGIPAMLCQPGQSVLGTADSSAQCPPGRWQTAKEGVQQGLSSLVPGLPGPKARFMTTEDRIAQLEDQIHKLQGQQADLRKQLAKAQLDQWQGRIEDLEVQMHLGAVEASDKAKAQLHKLRDRWADARRQFEDSIKTASSVADTVRTGLEKAVDDLRQALLESKNKLSSSSGH